MLAYIIKRIFWTIPTVFGVSFVIFYMVHVIPGDPAIAMLGNYANKASIEVVREEMGLNEPLMTQYSIYMTKLMQGDLGTSIISKQPVAEEFMARFPATAELALVALTIAALVGVSAGIVSAVKRYSIFDYSSMIIALIGVSMPVFWFGLILIYFFSVELDLLPVSGRLGYEFDIDRITGFYLIDSLIFKDYDAFFDALKHLILPAITLASVPLAIIARVTRASMLEVLREDYVKTAKAKGVPIFRVIMIHTFRNALIPIVTVIGLVLGTLFSGAILTETTFAWPGIGKWIINAVYQRDFPIIQSATMVISLFFIFSNLFVDILYTVINPKIRLK